MKYDVENVGIDFDGKPPVCNVSVDVGTLNKLKSISEVESNKWINLLIT